MGLEIQGSTLMKYTDDPVTVPEGVTEIADLAFSNARVSAVHLPDSLTKLGYGAFRYCGRLEHINLPAGLTELPGDAFEGCHLLRTLELPPNLTKIGNGALRLCGFSQLELPETLEVIGAAAVGGCQLTAVHLPEHLRKLGGWSFLNCGLTEVMLPDHLEEIGPAPFDDDVRIRIRTEFGTVTVLPRSDVRKDRKELQDVYTMLHSGDAAQCGALFDKLKAFSYKAASAVVLAQKFEIESVQKWLKRFTKRLLEEYVKAGETEMLCLLLNAAKPTKAQFDEAVSVSQACGQVHLTALLMDRSAAAQGGKRKEMKL